MPSTQQHPKFERKILTFEVNEVSTGWTVTVSERGGNGWGVGVIFPNEEHATKAGQAILDYSYGKVEFHWDNKENKPDHDKNYPKAKRTKTRPKPPVKTQEDDMPELDEGEAIGEALV